MFDLTEPSPRHEDLPTTPCRTCGTPIVWTVAASTGKRMPVDAEPVADGNLWLGGRNPIRAHVLQGAQLRNRRLLPEGKVYRSHFATCPATRTRHPRNP